MMRRRTVVTSVIALGFSLSGHSQAQGAPKPAPPEPPPAKAVPAPVPPPPAAPAPAAGAVVAQPPAGAPAAAAPASPVDGATLVAPSPAPPPAPVLAAPSAPAPTAQAAPVEPPPADPEPDLPPVEHYSEGEDSWYDSIEFSAFVDAYFGVNYNLPKPQSGRNVLRPHDSSNGFALSWVGVNASYPADPVGATLSFRFGPTAHQIGTACVSDDKSNCDSGNGLENVKQAFGSWKPGGADSRVEIDLGKFDTPFGAEVSESHLNMNYTRSMLYASQPLFHTGLRASVGLSDALDFKLLAVNGWNNSLDNNVGKSFGAQLNFHLKNADDADLLSVSLGYMGGPEHDDTATVTCKAGERFSTSSVGGCVAGKSSPELQTGVVDRASSNTEGLRHLLDLVVTANPIERLRLILNADYGVDRRRKSDAVTEFESASYYGALLGARVAVVDQFGVAARGEYFHDSAGTISGYPAAMDLFGGTLTLDYEPSDYLTIRLDNRFDWAARQIFRQGVRDQAGSQFTTTLGVVAHTD